MGLMLVTLAVARVSLEHQEHLGLHVAGQNRSRGPDPLGQADAVVAGAGPDVGDGRTLGDLERIEHRLGLLFVDSRLAKEPVDPFPGHDVGDLPAHVEAGRVAPGIGFPPAALGLCLWLRLRLLGLLVLLGLVRGAGLIFVLPGSRAVSGRAAGRV